MTGALPRRQFLAGVVGFAALLVDHRPSHAAGPKRRNATVAAAVVQARATVPRPTVQALLGTGFVVGRDHVGSAAFVGGTP